MKQVRGTRRKSTRGSVSTVTDRTVLPSEQEPDTEQLAKDYLLEISNTAPLDVSDPLLEMHRTFEHEGASPASKKSAWTQSNFTEAHSVQLCGDGNPGGKHKYLIRKKDLSGSPVRRKLLQRRINYIEYSPTRRHIFAEESAKEPQTRELRGNTVYVAKIRTKETGLPDSPLKKGRFPDCRFRVCEEVQPSVSHPKMWSDLKRIAADPKKPFHSASGNKGRGIFELDRLENLQDINQRYHREEEVDFMARRFRHMVADSRLNVLNLRLTAPKSSRPPAKV